MSRKILQDMRQTGQYADLSHGRVRYQVAGPENGIPVLLVHGLAGHFHVWDNNFDALAQAGFRVLRTDLYGRGCSDRVAVPHSSKLYVSQIDELLQHTGIHGPVSLIGLSMGGAVITHFASTHPERVRSMLWVDSYGIHVSGDPLVNLARVPLLGDAVMGTLGGIILRQAPKRGVHEPHRHTDFSRWFTAPLRVQGTKRALLSSLRHFMTEDHRPRFLEANELKVPKLMVWGIHDRILPFDYGKKLHALIPTTEFVAFEHSGHMPHMEEPEKFNRLAVQFLSDADHIR